MDGHGRSTTATVAELRLRLYRQQPAAGAVAAYAAALRAEPVRPPRRSTSTAVGPATRRPPWLAVLTAAVCAVAAVAAATMVGQLVPALVAPSAPATPTSGAAAGTRLDAPPLMGVPLGDLFGPGAATGHLAANGHRVVASVLCSGVGTIAVRIGTEAPTVLSCVAGPPALAIVASTGPLDRFTIAVTPDSPIRWSVAAAALPS